MKTFHDGKITLHAGDCLDVLKAMPENSIDAVVTDPPYHLTSIVKRFSKNGYSKSNLEQPADKNLDGIMDGSFRRLAKGFMGKQWDGGDIAFRPELWAEVLRVLKPGGHMVCFGGTRTYHRMTCAIEDAGFEIRDQLAWVFGSGFPKSHSMRDIGRPELGTALKPSFEPICLARKPLSESTVAANVLRWGTGALNIDGCRVPHVTVGTGNLALNPHLRKTIRNGPTTGASNIDTGSGDLVPSPLGRWPANLCHDGSPEVLAGFPETGLSAGGSRGAGGQNGCYSPIAGQPDFAPGFGDSGSAARFFASFPPEETTTLKPDGETLNVHERGTSSLRRARTCDAEMGSSPDQAPENDGIECYEGNRDDGSNRQTFLDTRPESRRFWYGSKADGDDRLGSKHPTVKPVDLMQWLVRLVCPKGATVLDLFAGTGTTGAASFIEGRRCILIEREAEYLADIERRMGLLLSGPDERARKLAQAEPHETLPLFA
jgi:site-specific DNA-methyltransferase (adenine-specific)